MDHLQHSHLRFVDSFDSVSATVRLGGTGRKRMNQDHRFPTLSGTLNSVHLFCHGHQDVLLLPLKVQTLRVDPVRSTRFGWDSSVWMTADELGPNCAGHVDAGRANSSLVGRLSGRPVDGPYQPSCRFRRTNSNQSSFSLRQQSAFGKIRPHTFFERPPSSVREYLHPPHGPQRALPPSGGG